MVNGVYLQLHDGMTGEYITIQLNMSLKGWNARWFYMKQSHLAIRCDVDHVPENQKSWSEKPTSADMDWVKELLELMRGTKVNRVVVVVSFIVRRIQPCKERAHAGFDFKGDTDDTRERTERLSRDDVLEQATELFSLTTSFSMSGQMRHFKCTNPPPQVKVSIVCSYRFLSCTIAEQ